MSLVVYFVLVVSQVIFREDSLNAMPMHRGVIWQEIVHCHLHIVVLVKDERGARELAIDQGLLTLDSVGRLGVPC